MGSYFVDIYNLVGFIVKEDLLWNVIGNVEGRGFCVNFEDVYDVGNILIYFYFFDM